MTPEVKDPLKIYLDDGTEPFQIAHPPLRFQLATLGLPDGPHILRVEAPNGLAPPTIKEIPFCVRNGVAISISGLEPGQTISGQLDLIVNAYAGSTELNFEPKRAETPEPIPTWAWVLLLAVGAWTLSYLLSPVRTHEVEAAAPRALEQVGLRIYSDTCARCHGEDANGVPPRVPAVRDSNRATAESPYALLSFVVTSKRGSMMPAWGTRLTNEEIVGVVNHVRTSWGHDGRTIQLKHRSPPQGPVRQVVGPDGQPLDKDFGIRRLEEELAKALILKEEKDLAQCCYPKGSRPILFRTDGVFAVGEEEVSKAWKEYFVALGRGSVVRLQLIDARYDYDEEQVTPEKIANGAYVIGMGRLFLATKNASGREEVAKGRFIRVYQFFAGNWTLVFDFADIPMNVGCTPDAPPDAPVCEPPPQFRPNDLGWDDVVKLMREAFKGGKSAPHGQFWKDDLTYEAFTSEGFPAPEFGGSFRFVQPWNSAESNLIRALRDGHDCLLKRADGTLVRADVGRMPKGRDPVPDLVIDRLAAWIDAGCPRTLGEASTLPKEEVTFPLPGGAGGSVPGGGGPTPEKPPEPAVVPAPAPAGFPQPGGTPPGPAVAPPLPPALPSKPVEGPVIGYAEAQQILGSYLKTASAAPHQDFWTLSYAEFVAFQFPFAEGEDGMIRLVTPGDGEGSNLIKALKDGEGITVRLADGREEVRKVKRMPPRGKKKPTEEDLAKLIKWIDAGCPEEGRP